MEDDEQIYLNFENNDHQDSISETLRPRPITNSRCSEESMGVSSSEPIDEDLLEKTSQLHESLRNLKLLKFELLEAQIMRKQTYQKAQTIQQEIAQMDETKSKMEKQNCQAAQQLSHLQQEIKQQKKANLELIRRIQVQNKQFVKNQQEKQKIEKDGIPALSSRKSNRVKEHGYISIEAIRLHAENQSKKQLITEIKSIINQVKSNLTRKQQINQELELEYQQLLRQIKRQEKRTQAYPKLQEEQFKSDLSQNSPVPQLSEKENDINAGNVDNSLSCKPLQPKKKNSERNVIDTVNKKQQMQTSCLRSWVQTGKKLSKKVY